MATNAEVYASFNAAFQTACEEMGETPRPLDLDEAEYQREILLEDLANAATFYRQSVARREIEQWEQVIAHLRENEDRG